MRATWALSTTLERGYMEMAPTGAVTLAVSPVMRPSALSPSRASTTSSRAWMSVSIASRRSQANLTGRPSRIASRQAQTSSW